MQRRARNEEASLKAATGAELKKTGAAMFDCLADPQSRLAAGTGGGEGEWREPEASPAAPFGGVQAEAKL